MRDDTQSVHPLFADVDFSENLAPDHYERMAALHARGERSARVKLFGQPSVLVVGHRELSDMLGDDSSLPAKAAYQRASGATLGHNLLTMAGDEHRITRALVAAAFQPAAIRQLASSLLIPIAHEIVDGFSGRQEADLAQDYAHRYSFAVITRMIGVPVEDEIMFLDWLRLMFRYMYEPEAATAAGNALADYCRPILAQRRKEPRQDIISLLVHAEVEGRQLDEDAIISFLRLLYPAGAETTFLSIGAVLYHVLVNPVLAERCLASREYRAALVEEVLRLSTATPIVPRYVESETEIAGLKVSANSWVLLGIGAANHDPAVYQDPDALSVADPPRHHLSFGRGPHFCIGTHLAREELQISLDILLRRLIGLRLEDAQKIERTGSFQQGIVKLPVLFDMVVPA